MGKVRGFKNRLEPFGATKARGKGFAKERAYKNRIHELEQQVAALERREAVAHSKAMDQERLVRASHPTAPQLASLAKVCNLPMLRLVELGLENDVRILCGWLSTLGKA